MKLYDYFRSSACFRVRIALNLKQLNYEKIAIHLVNNGGEQHLPAYQQVNPQQLVPCLEHDGQIINQSLAIIEYLDEVYPEPALFPNNPFDKAMIRSLSLMVACDIHPLNNLRVMNRLQEQFSAEEDAVLSWYHHWLKIGLSAIETKLQTLKRSKSVCFGDSITMADVCLIPQVYNAKRYNLPLDDYPLIRQIDDYCQTLDAFKQAAPVVL